jgi:hypothetical protein
MVKDNRFLPSKSSLKVKKKKWLIPLTNLKKDGKKIPPSTLVLTLPFSPRLAVLHLVLSRAKD